MRAAGAGATESPIAMSGVQEKYTEDSNVRLRQAQMQKGEERTVHIQGSGERGLTVRGGGRWINFTGGNVWGINGRREKIKNWEKLGAIRWKPKNTRKTYNRGGQKEPYYVKKKNSIKYMENWGMVRKWGRRSIDRRRWPMRRIGSQLAGFSKASRLMVVRSQAL